MEKYQVFARKYRPQLFDEVVGQETVVQILKNSLELEKTSQAYLFSGPRGVGKTTLTRLLAKALNCQNKKENNEPCNECASCKEIMSSCSLDVIEIDGASNRGIDDIRKINETVGYSPSNGKYRIYIIDEVHMLTKEAFNALLKTLEEPPPTIKFFFATTEPHKVLPTITSRCQRFDLKPISKQLIVDKLKQITSEQKREIEETALNQISKLSEGSLRDAESILDQILCYGDEKVTLDTINQIFGLISQDLFFELDEAVNNCDIKAAFTITDTLYKSGKDFAFFIEQLIEHFRKVLTSILIKDKKLEDSDPYIKTIKIYSVDQCTYILDLLINGFIEIQKTGYIRCYLEMLLTQIIKSKHKIPLQALVKRLSDLEKSIKQNNPSVEKTKSIKLAPIPFNLSKPEPIKPKNPKPIQDSILDEPLSILPKMNADKPKILKPQIKPTATNTPKPQCYYDTMLNFTAVELNGIIKKGE